MKQLLFGLFLLSIMYPFGDVEKRSVALGELSCTLSLKSDEKAFASLVSLHDNENTGIEAYKQLPEHVRFDLIELKQGEERLLKLKHKSNIYRFDPNRIFTETGIRSTLRYHNRYPTPEIERQVKVFSDTLLAFIGSKIKSGYIISLHNNTNDRFSINTYIDSEDTEELFIQPNEDVDDFILVSDPDDFAFFKSHRVNTVLLADTGFEDDGSLSVYCLQNNIPYINIEAEHGHLQRQKELLILTHKLMAYRTGRAITEPLSLLPRADPTILKVSSSHPE